MDDTTDNNAGTERLVARELPSAINSAALLDEHQRANGGVVRTRFPPEPNGYLHVGHAKSMNMNFELAFEKLGVPVEKRETIFRYDDTNPEAESDEYIQSLRYASPTARILIACECPLRSRLPPLASDGESSF